MERGDEENEKMLIKESKGKGRYLVCKRDLKGGECIAQAKPYLLIVNQSRNREICDYCFNSIPSSSSMNNNDNDSINNNNQCKDDQEDGISCQNCKQVYYCSGECKENAFEMIHSVE
eukprot:TRINITY_DN3092_c0_g2_i1.p1 TRINITY_DN3092_c0_g2~~TRINITY_DN3092_c0_g2_i1.p1  ORF type:complete len:117 (-),score=44.89 TRINITY_DN3092_c0_g2_i1:747-1097(-)